MVSESEKFPVPTCVFCEERKASIGVPGMGKPSCSSCKLSFTRYLHRGLGHPPGETPRPGGGWIAERAHELATIWGGETPW